MSVIPNKDIVTLFRTHPPLEVSCISCMTSYIIRMTYDVIYFIRVAKVCQEVDR